MKKILFTISLLTTIIPTQLASSPKAKDIARKINLGKNSHNHNRNNGNNSLMSEKFEKNREEAQNAQIRVRIPAKSTPKKENRLVVGSLDWVKANAIKGK